MGQGRRALEKEQKQRREQRSKLVTRVAVAIVMICLVTAGIFAYFYTRGYAKVARISTSYCNAGVNKGWWLSYSFNESAPTLETRQQVSQKGSRVIDEINKLARSIPQIREIVSHFSEYKLSVSGVIRGQEGRLTVQTISGQKNGKSIEICHFPLTLDNGVIGYSPRNNAIFFPAREMPLCLETTLIAHELDHAADPKAKEAEKYEDSDHSQYELEPYKLCWRILDHYTQGVFSSTVKRIVDRTNNQSVEAALGQITINDFKTITKALGHDDKYTRGSVVTQLTTAVAWEAIRRHHKGSMEEWKLAYQRLGKLYH